MKNFEGAYFPDDETHLIEWMTKKGLPRLADGFPSYQFHKYEVARNLCPFRRRAVDVGAHIGQWSRALALDFADVVAFEPVERFAECWHKNMEGFDNAVLHECALGARPRIAIMKTYTEGSNGDTHIAVEGDTEGGTAVSVAPLDDFDLSGVDLIKIDCEGYELEVIKGAAATIAENRPLIIVEQKRGKGAYYGIGDTEAVTLLRNWGYKVSVALAGDYIMVPGE